jgi:hypothetical protein
MEYLKNGLLYDSNFSLKLELEITLSFKQRPQRKTFPSNLLLFSENWKDIHGIRYELEMP